MALERKLRGIGLTLQLLIGSACLYVAILYPSQLGGVPIATILGVFGAINIYVSITRFFSLRVLKKNKYAQEIQNSKRAEFCPINGLVQDGYLQEQHNPVKTAQPGERIRLKLFFRISVALTFMFLLLTYGAFRAASVDFENKQYNLMSNVIPNMVHHYESENVSLLSNSEKLAWLNKYLHSSFDMLILNVNGQLLTHHTSAFSDITDDFIADIKTSSLEESGEILKNGKSYAWRISTISNSSDRLVFLYKTSVNDAQNFLSTLGAPIAITLIIILWVSIWLTQFLATLFEKLNDQKQKLKYRALHDSLTDLPNRALMADRLEQAILIAERARTHVGLLFIDLNLFKKVNDSYGHQCGDKLLVSLAQRLKAEIRRSDTVARLGGDEFSIILQNVSLESAQSFAQKVLSAIERVVEVDSNKLYVSASIGIALFPAHACDSQQLIQKADIAMYTAKKSGNTIATYNTEFDKKNREKLKLTTDLRESLKQRNLDVWYQPIINIKTRKIHSIEALIRWQHQTLGLVDSRILCQIAEHSDLMKSLTSFTLNQALKDFAGFLSSGLVEHMQINVSIATLQDPGFNTYLLDLLKKNNVKPQCITLEIAEKIIGINSEQSANTLKKLSQQNVNIIVDDFGSSYTSLSNLQNLKVGGLKIYDGIIRKTLSEEKNIDIVKAAIQLGHALDLKICAEGVDQKKVLHMLLEHNCDYAQGYLFSEALPKMELYDWIKNYDHRRFMESQDS